MSETKSELRIITVNIPKKYLEYIKKLQEWGLTPSRSEYIRNVVMRQIKEDLDLAKSIDHIIQPEIDPKLYVRVPNGDGTSKIYNRIREA